MVNSKYYGLGTAPSVIRALFAYGLEQSKLVGPENVFDYSLGNPSIPAPEAVNKTIADLAKNHDSIALHGYSVAQGFASTRRAIADNLNERFNADASADQLFLTCGCAPALTAVANALSSSVYDEFIVIAPYFPEYEVFFGTGGAKLTVVPPDMEHFQINFAELEKSINEHTVAVIINSPNNPSGVVYTHETIGKLADILTKKSAEYGHAIYIVADEPYRELVYGGVEVPFIPAIYRNTIVCYSWSKSLSLPGERIGYVYTPGCMDNGEEVYYAVQGAARAIGHVCPPTLIQKVIEKCVGCAPDLKAYDGNRMLLYSSLTEMGYEMAKPDGAFYAFVKAPNCDADEFSERAKLEHNLLIVPGRSFGVPEYFRLSYCVSNDMIRRSLPKFRQLIEEYR